MIISLHTFTRISGAAAFRRKAFDRKAFGRRDVSSEQLQHDGQASFKNVRVDNIVSINEIVPKI